MSEMRTEIIKMELINLIEEIKEEYNFNINYIFNKSRWEDRGIKNHNLILDFAEENLYKLSQLSIMTIRPRKNDIRLIIRRTGGTTLEEFKFDGYTYLYDSLDIDLKRFKNDKIYREDLKRLILYTYYYVYDTQNVEFKSIMKDYNDGYNYIINKDGISFDLRFNRDKNIKNDIDTIDNLDIKIDEELLRERFVEAKDKYEELCIQHKNRVKEISVKNKRIGDIIDLITTKMIDMNRYEYENDNVDKNNRYKDL